MYGGEYGQGPGPGENIPAWLIFDQQYRDRYIFAGLQPGQRIPKKWMESGVIVTADTLEELAAKAGLPAEALAATVERFNGFARSGIDEDFHRGESAYDRYYGDPTNKPNPNLGEISHGPYYAAKMVPGDLGTKGGIRHRRARPRAARRRFGDRRSLCRRQRQRTGDGPHLSGTRRHDRPGDGVRLPCGPAPGREGLRCRSISTRRSARELDPVEFSWTSSDIQLYHLGLGAGQDPMDKRELRYLVDDTPQVLPTFGNVAQSFHMTRAADGAVPRHRHRAEQGAARQRGGDRRPRRSRRRAPVARSPGSPTSGTRARPR